MKKPLCCAVWALGLVAAGTVSAEVVEIGASKDNSLYQDNSGNLSNGSGQHLFVGRSLIPDTRRGLIAFDIAGAVPAGSTIDSVSLTLTMNKTIAPAHPVSLHRALADWGEGASDADGEEGFGDTAQPGDATWLHTFFPGDFWTAVGGDFDATASATIPVNAEGPYTWSSAQMAADAQGWLDRPSTSFGWVIVGNETTAPTAKRFASRENPDAGTQPKLTIEYTPGADDGGGVPATSTTGMVIAALLLLLLGPFALRRRAGV